MHVYGALITLQRYMDTAPVVGFYINNSAFSCFDRGPVIISPSLALTTAALTRLCFRDRKDRRYSNNYQS